MKRREARKHIFNLVFQTEFQEEVNTDEIIATYNEEYADLSKDTAGYIEHEYKDIVRNIEDIDAVIDSFSIGWRVDRLPKTDLAILRIGVYEIMFNDDIPDGVPVNEAVELSKSFSDDKAPSFINAVLVKVAGSRGK